MKKFGLKLNKKCAFTLADTPCTNSLPMLRKFGFTLAEVLITLGIIGIVAALTIPSLLSNYQKKQYYTKFMKARSSLENALKLYAHERGCDDDPLCGKELYEEENNNFALELSKYFNGATLITQDNYEEICKGYNKVAYNYDGTNIEENAEWLCGDGLGGNPSANGFITMDGMLFSFYQDDGDGGGSLVDINGPDNGPNTYGRDIFVFYIHKDKQKDNLCNNMWGRTKACNDNHEHKWDSLYCYDNTDGWNCAARLIEEGKMNY